MKDSVCEEIYFPFFQTRPILMSIEGTTGIPISSGSIGSMEEKKKQPHFPCLTNLSVVMIWLQCMMTLGLIPRLWNCCVSS